MSDEGAPPPVPASLVWATDLDVLPLDRVIEQRDGYLFIHSPSNPTHYWGSFLLFDDAPIAGDGARWAALFETEYAADPRVTHRAFGWTAEGVGAAHEEFIDRGYELDDTIGLVAEAGMIQPHPRESRDVTIHALEGTSPSEDALWDAVIELEVTTREEGHDEASYRAFCEARLRDLRVHFAAGRGAWYVAVDTASGNVAGSCGVVVTGSRGRFQRVVTAAEHRRKGVCSRLVVEAAHRSAERHGAEQFVIAADADYHALGIYESLGFEPRERTFGVFRQPERSKPAS